MNQYIKALQTLNQVNKLRGMKLSLDNMLLMSKLMGNPQNQNNYIHVTGTNGKGSVALKLAKCLEIAGYKTGLFTSPHLFSFREEIQLSGNLIEKDFVGDCIERIRSLSEKKQIPLTFFEYLTLMCFQYFKESKADFSVIEVGLGGRQDATNIIDPLLSVITTIDYDHCEFLGKTLVEIAREKSGIIKFRRPVLIGQNAQPYQVFQDKCRDLNCQLCIVNNPEANYDFDEENNLIVKNCIQILKQTYPHSFNRVNYDNIQQGIQHKQLCRLEQISKEQLSFLKQKYGKVPKNIYFDVGHNPKAIETTIMTLRKQYKNNPIRSIFGTSSLKDDYNSLKVLYQHCSRINLISAKHVRAKKIQDLKYSADLIVSNCSQQNNHATIEDIIANGNINDTLHSIFDNQISDDEVVLIHGSFFIMIEARQFFNYKLDLDPIELNPILITSGNN